VLKSNLIRSSSGFLSVLLLAALLLSGLRGPFIAFAATQVTWTGAHPPTTLSNPANWLGNVAPAAGDDLFFIAGIKRKSIRNNYPNLTSFNSLNFSGSNYNLRKNSLTLTGGINTSNTTGTNLISLPLRVDGAQAFTSGNSGTSLTLAGPLDLNGNVLTITGAGNVLGNGVISNSGGITKGGSGTLTLVANNTYTGTTTMTAGTLLVNGSQSSSNVNLVGGILGGTGRVGAITGSGGSIRPGASLPGILNSGNVTLNPTTSVIIDLNGPIAGTDYRQLNISGTVSLGGGVLDSSANFQSTVGQNFTIINNDGNDAVVGTFAGLAEGATLLLGGLPFVISYQGGTGNDVVITRVSSQAPPPPAISISDVTLTEGHNGTVQAIFPLNLSAPGSQTVTVDYATGDETAASPDDYAQISGTLTFNPGETTKNITVTVNGDTLNETNETFLLTLRRSTNASLVNPEAHGTILNDDPLPSISVEDVSVTEGDTGVTDAVLPVTLSTASGQTVTVNFATADGIATEHPGNDYDGMSGTITFVPGETDDEVDVTVHGDSNVESNETFLLNLTGPTLSTIADAQGVATIMDDDAAPTPTPTPTPNPSPTPTPTPAPPGDTVQFSAASYNVNEGAGSVMINVTRSGNTSNSATVEYGTFDSSASERTDYTTAVGKLRFAPGETSKSFIVFITDDVYIEGAEPLSVVLANPQGVNLGSQSTAAVTIIENDTAPTQLNPIDDAGFYVRQHYVDFLNREPDPSGFNFWLNQITVCGSDANCVMDRRINVSAAYFLSIEFQQTGYMIYLLQKSSFANMPRYREFMRDTQEIGRDVIVNAPGWEAQLEANKDAFVQDWVNRAAFRTIYDSKSDAEFIDTLFANAGIVDVAQRDSMVAGLQNHTETRTSVLRRLIDNPSFRQNEVNSAFVLMQYFGYLRRNPDDAPDNNLSGFNFWLGKLNQFNGNYISAEMVKSFIVSTEYRQRFGQP
jgi:autotransporter-associated beta strand protein